jgi:dolichol-phosphate mannosyltransferase
LPGSLIVIPTYNEIENIEPVLSAIFSLNEPFHVLIVDDSSPDGTGHKVSELKSRYTDRLHLVVREGKQGLGTAYIAGFKWGIEKGYDYIFEMDADFSHNPNDLPRLLKACQDGADVAIGSRYTRGGRVENWPMGRVIMSKWASIYVRMITWLPVKDTTAGFVCYKRQVLEAIRLERIKFVGYAFQIEMKYAAWKLGFKLAEVPITFIDRQRGKSKMSMKIFREAFSGVWKMRMGGNAKKRYSAPGGN